MTTAATTARQALAALVTTALADQDPAWTVYAAPPGAMAGPCAIVAPGDPYVEPVGWQEVRVRLRLSLLLPIAAPGYLDTWDTLAQLIVAQLPDGWSWERTESMTPATVDGVEYLAGVLAIAARGAIEPAEPAEPEGGGGPPILPP